MSTTDPAGSDEQQRADRDLALQLASQLLAHILTTCEYVDLVQRADGTAAIVLDGWVKLDDPAQAEIVRRLIE